MTLYRFYRFKDRPVSWLNAREYCQDLGAKLVEIDSHQENAAIINEIKKHSWSRAKKQFWMGLKDDIIIIFFNN